MVSHMHILSRIANPPPIWALVICWAICVAQLAFQIYNIRRGQTGRVKRIEQPVWFWFVIVLNILAGLGWGFACLLFTKAAI